MEIQGIKVGTIVEGPKWMNLSLAFVASKALGFMSMPMDLRRKFIHAMAVVPPPRKGSKGCKI